MNDCTNLDIRDLLPDLARGALAGSERVAVEQHLASCASCRAELALVRDAQAMLSVVPPVDSAGIVAAVARSRVSGQRAPRRVWLAAASIAAIVGAAALATSVMWQPGESDLAPVAVQVEQPSAPIAAAPPPVEPTRPTPRRREELVVGAGVSELADADLESLLGVIDGLDAELDEEPAAVLPFLEGDV